jgi:hypothetical protein
MISKLVGFSSPKEFSFKNLNDYQFGGVYIIYAIDRIGNKKIVKIGESNFIYRRIANYLTPLDEKDKNNPKKITKRTVQDKMEKGIKDGLCFQIIWKVAESTKVRKQLEKDLIEQFKSQNNGNRPIMNKNNR